MHYLLTFGTQKNAMYQKETGGLELLLLTCTWQP